MLIHDWRISRVPCVLGLALAASLWIDSNNVARATVLAPLPVVCATESGNGDADDPAFWIDASDASNARVLVTYKAGDIGQLKAFRASDCTLVSTIDNLDYPNNVDVEYGLEVAGETIDIAVVTERFQQRFLVYELPSLTLRATVATELTDPMGVALYRDPSGDIYVFVSSKNSKSSGTIQHFLLDGSSGEIDATYLGRFGSYDSEVEALSVDDAAGRLFASNERVRIDVYDADSTELLDSFGDSGFAADREGNASYTCGSSSIVVVSDQGADSFRAFDSTSNYDFVGSFEAEGVSDTDGIDILADKSVPGFPSGIFAAQTRDSHVRLFHLADVEAELGLPNCAGESPAPRDTIPKPPSGLQAN